MKFLVFQISRRGGREKNEDRMGYCYTRESGLFVLAWTRRAANRGRSRRAAGTANHFGAVPEGSAPCGARCDRVPSPSLMAAHHQIIRYASEKGMPTPRAPHWWRRWCRAPVPLVHCGDSRLYVVRDGELLTRTRDHSYLEQQSAGDPHGSPNRNILFNLPRLADQAGV